ncbi:MAG: hypothetical protein NZZ41_05715 [Candidatus Dojkabacteria bacterium]|nr:hypothetical protein [Candidatus Dojkabacteria bacterium]
MDNFKCKSSNDCMFNLVYYKSLCRYFTLFTIINNPIYTKENGSITDINILTFLSLNNDFSLDMFYKQNSDLITFYTYTSINILNKYIKVLETLTNKQFLNNSHNFIKLNFSNISNIIKIITEENIQELNEWNIQLLKDLTIQILMFLKNNKNYHTFVEAIPDIITFLNNIVVVELKKIIEYNKNVDKKYCELSKTYFVSILSFIEQLNLLYLDVFKHDYINIVAQDKNKKISDIAFIYLYDTQKMSPNLQQQLTKFLTNYTTYRAEFIKLIKYLLDSINNTFNTYKSDHYYYHIVFSNLLSIINKEKLLISETYHIETNLRYILALIPLKLKFTYKLPQKDKIGILIIYKQLTSSLEKIEKCIEKIQITTENNKNTNMQLLENIVEECINLSNFTQITLCTDLENVDIKLFYVVQQIKKTIDSTLYAIKTLISTNEQEFIIELIKTNKQIQQIYFPKTYLHAEIVYKILMCLPNIEKILTEKNNTHPEIIYENISIYVTTILKFLTKHNSIQLSQSSELELKYTIENLHEYFGTTKMLDVIKKIILNIKNKKPNTEDINSILDLLDLIINNNNFLFHSQETIYHTLKEEINNEIKNQFDLYKLVQKITKQLWNDIDILLLTPLNQTHNTQEYITTKNSLLPIQNTQNNTTNLDYFSISQFYTYILLFNLKIVTITLNYENIIYRSSLL